MKKFLASLFKENKKISSKIILTLVLFCGFVENNVSAQNRLFIKVGGNYSYLKKPSYGEPGVSYLYGIGKDWKLYRWIQLRTELLISNAKAALKDRSVQPSYLIRDFPYLPSQAITINYYDIDIQLRYVEIPLLLKVEKSLQKNLSIGLEIGYSLKFPPKDGSRNTIQREIKSTDLTEEERENFRFDYRFTSWPGEDYSYNGRGLCPTVGMYVDYSKLLIGWRYQVDYVDWVSEIRIGEDIPLRIFILSMGYRF